MSDQLVDTTKHGSFTIEVRYDSEASSPRGDCNLGLFLGFPHRSYEIGDQKFDPSEYSRHCEACNSSGEVPGSDESCPACGGEGCVRPTSERQIMEWIKQDWDATVVLKVGMIDHSGVSYYIGGGPNAADPGGWDSGTCGFILDAKANRDECFGDQAYLNEAGVTKALAAEIDEYSKWANGEVYWIRVLDRNGNALDEPDLGWVHDLRGWDRVEEYIRDEIIPCLPPEPDKLYNVRLTAEQLTLLGEAHSQGTGTSPERLAVEIIGLMLTDMRKGQLPNVASFSEAHDHVDANEYILEAHTRLGLTQNISDLLPLDNAAVALVDLWLGSRQPDAP